MSAVEYDEFGLFHENAHEFGIPYHGPPAVRRQGVEVAPDRYLSSLVWGTSDPELVFLHGGAQNAHTWDTVALALGRPLLSVDLPGHGHSDAGRGGSFDLEANATDIALAVGQLAPSTAAVVGMSLGGLTAIVLARVAPELVRRLVLVDVTPGVNSTKSTQITEFINGPPTFASFDELLARTMEFNPTRSESSLRRGILHNAVQQPDGSWTWRYRRFAQESDRMIQRAGDLWDDVSASTMPIMLVRGMLPQSVVDDADETELLRRRPDTRVEHVADAGHSVQGDSPVELARLIADFVNLDQT